MLSVATGSGFRCAVTYPDDDSVLGAAGALSPERHRLVLVGDEDGVAVGQLLRVLVLNVPAE